MKDKNDSSFYLPSNVKRKEIYHKDWIDFNKNGTMDPYEDPNRPVEERVEDLLSRMTLEEKIAQLERHGMPHLTPKEGAMKINEIQREAIEDSALGIPHLICGESLHGLITKGITVFPQAIALAATWNIDMLRRVAKAIAKETRAYGVNQVFSPVVNIIRDVRAGRTEESYGEDPYLMSVMAYVYCKAISEEGIVATPKHFVANFVGEGGRDSYEIQFNERILREIFFPGFKASIDAGALSLMVAFNSINGIPCTCNKWLLTQVLRQEWGFKGFTISDHNGIGDLINKHYLTDKPEIAAKLSLEAGLEVELPGSNVQAEVVVPKSKVYKVYGDMLLKAIGEGLVRESVLDEAVRRILRVKFLIGLFDDPYVDPERAEKICGSKEHAKLALEAAQEAIVLLKNENNLLPLNENKIKSIAVIDPFLYEPKRVLGTYSGTPTKIVTPLEGIKEKLKDTNIKIHYAKGCPTEIDRYIPIAAKYFVAPEGEKRERRVKIEYFDNPDLKGTPVVSSVDPLPWPGWFRYEWGYSPAHPWMEECEQFSVQITGGLIPPLTGTYEMCLMTSGGGARVWLDGDLLIDAWNSPISIPKTATVKLEAGRQYDIRVEYRKISGYASVRLGWDLIQSDEMKKAIEIAKKSDVTVIFAGIIEGEQRDRASLRLPGPQERLIEEALKVNENTIVVLITGSPVVGEWIYRVPALIQAWYPGQEGGKAIANVLFGDYNPAGRLPITWPHNEGQLPLYYNYKPSGRAYDYINMTGSPLFPFGYGLGYTTFEYSNLKIEVDKKTWTVKVSVDVKNTGDREGDEVVQLYIRDKISSIARPFKELKGFKRINLKPGEIKTVTFKLTPNDLATYDEDMRRIVESGEFEVMIGSSSEDIRAKGVFNIEETIKLEAS